MFSQDWWVSWQLGPVPGLRGNPGPGTQADPLMRGQIAQPDQLNFIRDDQTMGRDTNGSPAWMTIRLKVVITQDRRMRDLKKTCKPLLELKCCICHFVVDTSFQQRGCIILFVWWMLFGYSCTCCVDDIAALDKFQVNAHFLSASNHEQIGIIYSSAALEIIK